MITSFESPAGEYKKLDLSLDDLLIKPSSFIAIASGDAMIDVGIHDQDILIVNRAEEPRHMDVVIFIINGDMCCRLFDAHNRRLVSPSDNHPPIDINPDDSYFLEGIVTASIRCHRTRSFGHVRPD